MSEHPLDFLKDYSAVPVDDENPAATSATAGSVVEPPFATTVEPPNENQLKPKPAKSPRVRGKGRGKRVSVTKKELQKTQIRERRRQARKVIIDKCSCHLACMTKITPEQRQAVNESYWQMEHVEQKKFVKNHSVQGQVKRRRVPVDPLGGVDVKKAYTYAFYLPDDKGQLQTICCTFFLNTLGFRKGCGNHIYRAHMRDSLDDQRGKYERDHSLRDAVWDDILSYAPRTYHKGLKYNATALYLPNQLNAKLMHGDFKARREAVGEKPGSASFYCAILREMDVHFVEMDDFEIPERKPIVVAPRPPYPPSLPLGTEPPITEDPYPNINMQPPEGAPPVHSYQPSSSIQTFEPPPTLHGINQSPTIPSFLVEQKLIVPSYVDVQHHPSPSYHPVEVKQEPYYGLTVEPLNVPEPHYTEDNDDYSDSYSNMVAEPDYSESNYHSTPHSIIEPDEAKVEPHDDYPVRSDKRFFSPSDVHSSPEESKKRLFTPSDAYSSPEGSNKRFFSPEYSSFEASNPRLAPPVAPLQNPTPSHPYSEPVKTENKTDQKVQPVKKKRRGAASGAQSEEYPPIKRTKKFIARVRNITKRKQAHPVMQLECNCHLSCKEKISLEQQERINEQYWSMGFCDQRMFMLEHTERHSIKRRRAKLTSGVVRKGYTYSYRLTDETGGYQGVCCQFFLNTIGFGAGSGNVIYRAHQVELSEAISDKRGKFTRDTTMRDSMDDDILSYFSAEHQESGAPLDLSETDWSPKRMFNQYVQRQAAAGNDKPGSFGFYWRRVKQMKVIFAPKPEPKPNGSSKKKSRSSSSSQKRQEVATAVPPSYPHGYGMP